MTNDLLNNFMLHRSIQEFTFHHHFKIIPGTHMINLQEV